MPLVSDRFFRAHGLGNDYLVFERADGDPEPESGGGWPLHAAAVADVCRRGWGAGSDGLVVLLDRAPSDDGAFPIRMFNPDGSEFERSGNGLRVLGAWLARERLVADAPFRVKTGGEVVTIRQHGTTDEAVRDLSVDMGRARAGDAAAGPLGWSGALARVPHPDLGFVDFVPVWVGNPHAVVFVDDPSVELDGPLLRSLGPFLATHPGFARGTNVQLARVGSRDGGASGVEIGIWERGVGRTPASGTSSCAATVAAVVSGRLDPAVAAGGARVLMPGGELTVRVDPDLSVTLRGPVQEVGTGRLAPGFLARLHRLAGTGD
jgi:diaminopimelate epimerase